MAAFYHRGQERKRRHLEEEEAPAGTEIATTAYGTLLTLVISFTCLGRILLASDDNLPAVVHNLWQAQKKVGAAVQGVE